jgi:hypothetical protein
MELITERFKFSQIFPARVKDFSERLGKSPEEILFVRKGIPIDSQNISIEENERAAIRYITTPKLDRDNEILIPDGAILDDFRQSPSVLWAHKYDQLPIGKDLWIKTTKKGILAKTQYANHAFAEDVFQCVKGGFLNVSSVGFIPVETVTPEDRKAFSQWQEKLEKDYGVMKEDSEKAKNIYTKWILLEHSDVPVASNPSTLNIAVAKGEVILSSKFLADLGIQRPKTKQVVLASQFRKDIKEMVEDIEEIKKQDKHKEEEYPFEEFLSDLEKLTSLTKQLKQRFEKKEYSESEAKIAIEKRLTKMAEGGELLSGPMIEKALKLKILKMTGKVCTDEEVDSYFNPKESPFDAQTCELIRQLDDALMKQFQKRNQ